MVWAAQAEAARTVGLGGAEDDLRRVGVDIITRTSHCESFTTSGTGCIYLRRVEVDRLHRERRRRVLAALVAAVDLAGRIHRVGPRFAS